MHNATYELSRERVNELMLMRTKWGDTLPHFHRHVELYYVLSGKTSVTINDKTLVLSQGQLSVATPYDIHSYTRLEEGEAYIAVVPPKYLEDFFRFIAGKTAADHFLLNPEKTVTVERLLSALHTEGEENGLLVLGLINTLLGYIFREIPLVPATKKQSTEFVYQVLTYMQEHLSEPLNLEGLSRAFGYSKFHFSKRFNDNFHCNLNAALSILRARAVVEHTEAGKPLNEAIALAGYKSMRTFYRSFSEVYGVTFGEYYRALFGEKSAEK